MDLGYAISAYQPSACRRLTTIIEPAATALVADISNWYCGGAGTNLSWNYLKYRHSGGVCNILFVDGHVAGYTINQAKGNEAAGNLKFRNY